jgi:anti-sigma regulatory factor (Ser/Thr protein kinase)
MTARRVPVLSFELSAEPASVAAARRSVRVFAQTHSADQDLHGRVALAFSEAFANAVCHAYGDPDPRDMVCVAADIDDQTLEVVVIDHGSGLRPHAPTPGLGSGLKIIAACADAFAIREHQPSGTEIWMQFHLTPAPSD